MKNEILDKIVKAQSNHEDLIALIDDFTPLIKKYSLNLEYEDAKNDLILAFIEIILGINIGQFAKYNKYQMLSYLSVSIKNAYIRLSKKHCAYMKNELPIEEIWDEIDDSMFDNYDDLLVEDIKKYLTTKEFEIICKHYFIGLSISEIANQQGISRQAVNQVKNRAIRKLSKQFDIK